MYSPSSDTVIYSGTTTLPASQREGGSASGNLRMGITWIWITTMWRIVFLKMIAVIKTLS
jgi:hypothetical protein